MLFEKIKLENREEILLIVRRHWFVFLTRILGVIVMAILPFIVLLVASLLSATKEYVSIATASYSQEIIFFSALWLLISWMILAQQWTDHYLDIWVVTDRRIISIDQQSFFVRSVGSFRLERLQDMNVLIPGLFATLFNYGTVEAQTASGSESEFTVHGVPKPREIKSIILEATDRRMRSMSQGERNGLVEGL